MAIPRVSPQDDFSKMFHAKVWTGTVTIECMQTAKEESTTLTVKRSFGFTIGLGSRQAVGGEKTPRAFWTDDGTSKVEGTIEDKRVELGLEGDLAAVDTISGRVGGPLKWGPTQLAINPQDKTYRLIVNPVYFNERYVRKTYNNGQETVEIDTTNPGMGGSPIAEVVKPLPTAGTTLTGSAVVKEQYGSDLNRGMIDELIYTVKWNLSPAGPPPEFVIDKSSFERYIPNDDSGKVVIKSTKPDGAPALIRVTISSISKEPGTCMNSEDAGTDNDVEVLAAENPDFGTPQVSGGTITVVTKKEVKQTTLLIRCRDYGGWATVKADAKIKGEWKPLKATGLEKTRVQFPYDVDDNHVADAWEDKYGVVGKASASDDDDTPTGDGVRKGDGLTLYEEYRGFMVGGKHTDTNPKVKDLFLADATGGKIVAGATLFESLSKLNIHTTMTLKELGDTRIVNRNHAEGSHIVDQHGIPVINGPAGSDPEAISVDPNGDFGPPVATARITLPPGAFGADPTTVAHEIGHAVGIRHHDDGVAYVLWTAMEGPDAKKHIYEVAYDPAKNKVSGVLGLIRVFRESTRVEITDSVAGFGPYDKTLGGVKRLLALCSVDKTGKPIRSHYSGVQNCIMRYPDADAYIPISKPNSNERWLPDIPTKYKLDMLCDSKTGTGINDKTRKPHPRYGDAIDGGNCKKQIVISDKYAGA